MNTTNAADLEQGPAQRAGDRSDAPTFSPAPSAPAIAGSSTSASTIARSSTISQPTAMRPRRVSSRRRSSIARSSTTVLATDSDSPNTMPRHVRPAQQQAEARADRGGDGDLHDRARDRDRLDVQQVAQREVQADAEHQQDHADLGQLRRQGLVGDEARGERPDDHARQQVAHQRRQLQPVGQHAEHEGQHEADAEQGDQRGVVRHAGPRPGCGLIFASRRRFS